MLAMNFQNMDRRPFVCVAVVIAVLTLANLNNGRRRLGLNEPSGNRVMSFEESDAEMNTAIEQARESVDEFIAALTNKQPFRSRYSIKVPIAHEDGREHFWVTDPVFQGGEFVGTIANDPVSVKTVQYGDQVTIAKEEVSDWLYVENGRLIGGFTLRVMRNQLPPEERASFDAEAGLIFD